MGYEVVAVSVVTAFWAVVAIVLPIIFGRGPNKGVIQATLVISGFSCWLFWFLAYVHQMNPLIGPEMHATTVYAIKYLWDGNSSWLSPNETITTTAVPAVVAEVSGHA
ncbi:V-type proton ATPase subunit e [Hyalella azteca]|uniref:V-type proton ATPase subunit e n=1 Tax=Hyalella azteca TaxID=294128 RepID=A0A8B7PHT2_HYAAZ|nr:V-type proton ATPase subunit e [Hyalella azteca]